jgi:hypothetical protein
MESTAYRPSRESRLLDDLAESSQGASYSFARSDRQDYSPHDPIPLFLSDPEGEPDPQEFTGFTARPKARIASQIVAGVLAASAVAVLAALFHADISRLFVVYAKASMGREVAEQVAEPPAASPQAARQIPVKDPTRVSNPMIVASTDAKDIAVDAKPSREAIATAYQSALQAQTPQVPAPQAQAPVAAAPAPVLPAPARAPAQPARTLDADTLAGLMTRARSLLSIGDIAAARLLLERAANAQDASAAFLLAQTYDPAVLGTRDTRSITADPAAARDWYQKAAQLGSADAKQRLTQLQN